MLSGHGVTRQEGLPSLSDQVTPSVRAKFCQVNVSSGVAEDRFELSCFVIFNCLLRRFCISLKYNRKRQHWEIAARTTGESRRALTTKTRGLPATFSYELSDYSTILRKCTSDGEVVRLHVNPGDFSTPSAKVSSRTWGQPPPCTRALNVISFYATPADYSLVLYLQNLLSYDSREVTKLLNIRGRMLGLRLLNTLQKGITH